MMAARTLAPEKRSTFLERISAQLELIGRFGDADVDRTVRAALQGLVQEPAA